MELCPYTSGPSRRTLEVSAVHLTPALPTGVGKPRQLHGRDAIVSRAQRRWRNWLCDCWFQCPLADTVFRWKTALYRRYPSLQPKDWSDWEDESLEFQGVFPSDYEGERA